LVPHYTICQQEAQVYEQLAQACCVVQCSTRTWTHDILIVTPMLYFCTTKSPVRFRTQHRNKVETKHIYPHCDTSCHGKVMTFPSNCSRCQDAIKYGIY